MPKESNGNDLENYRRGEALLKNSIQRIPYKDTLANEN